MSGGVVGFGNPSAREDKQKLSNGEAFVLSIQYVLNNGQTVYHSFQTPNTDKRIHLRFKTFSSDRTSILMYENPTVTAYSFSWTPRDRNRETANSSTTTIQAVSTQSSLGTFIHSENNYGSGLTVSESQVLHSPEFILDQDTEYLFGMQSFAASNLTTLQLLWYEV